LGWFDSKWKFFEWFNFQEEILGMVWFGVEVLGIVWFQVKILGMVWFQVEIFGIILFQVEILGTTWFQVTLLTMDYDCWYKQWKCVYFFFILIRVENVERMKITFLKSPTSSRITKGVGVSDYIMGSKSIMFIAPKTLWASVWYFWFSCNKVLWGVAKFLL